MTEIMELTDKDKLKLNSYYSNILIFYRKHNYNEERNQTYKESKELLEIKSTISEIKILLDLTLQKKIVNLENMTIQYEGNEAPFSS